MLLHEHGTEFLERGWRVGECPQDGVAFGDLEGEHLDVSEDGPLQLGRQSLVVDLDGERSYEIIAHLNPREEQRASLTEQTFARADARCFALNPISEIQGRMDA